MAEPATVVRDLTYGDTARVTDPDVGEVSVMVFRPQETAEVAPGIQQFVFTHESGRIIGMNRTLDADEDGDWEACRLVVDDDGFQHALLLRPNGDLHLHTRREPGEPDDWEHRGVVQDIKPLESVEQN
ncbi:hypothetical protein SAMN05216218_1169 [Halorientalis regularis]|jgi:hypothetical protein|uniref:Uncharacterized protein n=1 Tax=Halorientalis regularis TaxID=660518 RepID=A0A1G7RSJ5_9EURY|nr:hypothetical protein SAMN05216218_1169 [Halorientalis regularis]